ncbi:MAG TPA: multiheme c-type cytochrome [Gemmataceae bacterium]|nr:multiheme c-type cytochrome [Gemmataceae bacterium]
MSLVFVVVALALVLAIGAAITTGCFPAKPQTQDQDQNQKANGGDLPAGLKDLAAKHFSNWPAGRKPDLVLVLSGEQHGYTQPCGCTKPLVGGLERRYNFIKLLRDTGLPVVAADLGDMYATEKLSEQAMMKFGMTLKALTLMDYSAICVGDHEFRIPLIDGLANTVLNDKPSFKILVANLTNKGDVAANLVEDGTVTNTNVKVGFVGTVGKSVEEQILKLPFAIKPRFGDNAQVLPEVMQKQNPDIRVLLYQGTPEEAKNLLTGLPKLAPKAPLPHVILCLSPPESDPSGETTIIANCQVAHVGHKGKYVGVFGIFREPDGSLLLKYNQVKLDDEFETPKDKAADSPVMKLLEGYSKDVKDKKLINQWPKVMHQMQVTFPKEKVAYVGSEACKNCHNAEFQIWDTSKHADAFTALENAKRPSNRQFDPECVRCHVVGFDYETGYLDEQRTPKFKGVGCENCHGPGSLHVNHPKDEKFQLAMSPWKRKKQDRLPDNKVEIAIDSTTCQKCHDLDNDPYFKFKDFWPKIAHGPNAKKK